MSREEIYAEWPRGDDVPDVGFDNEEQIGRALRLEPSQSEALAIILSRAFYDEPQFRYIIPDQQARLRLLPGFFRSAIHAIDRNGEIYTTKGIEGGALWIGPGSVLSPQRLMRMESPSISSRWDWADLRRCLNLAVHLDAVHQQLVQGLHWRLLVLGVTASPQSERIGETLMEPVLSRADFDGLPCYLETFNARSLPFYKRHGFRIAGSGRIPGGGPDFWAMIRTP